MKTFLQTSLLLLFFALALAACKKDPVEPPKDVSKQQVLPNPLPASALVKRVEWAPNDYETYTYNDKGQVSSHYFQYQFVQGDPTQIRSITYGFTYDLEGKPLRVLASGGFSATYSYAGQRIVQTQERYPDGKLAREVSYSYENNFLSQEIWRIPEIAGEPDQVYKYTFSYDDQGNMNRIQSFEKDSSQQYRLLQTVEYSDFDDKINPLSWKMRYPFLPQMQYQFNNPRKETITHAGGQTDTLTHTYQYSAEDLPIYKKTVKNSGEVLEATMQY